MSGAEGGQSDRDTGWEDETRAIFRARVPQEHAEPRTPHTPPNSPVLSGQPAGQATVNQTNAPPPSGGSSTGPSGGPGGGPNGGPTGGPAGGPSGGANGRPNGLSNGYGSDGATGHDDHDRHGSQRESEGPGVAISSGDRRHESPDALLRGGRMGNVCNINAQSSRRRSYKAKPLLQYLRKLPRNRGVSPEMAEQFGCWSALRNRQRPTEEDDKTLCAEQYVDLRQRSISRYNDKQKRKKDERRRVAADAQEDGAQRSLFAKYCERVYDLVVFGQNAADTFCAASYRSSS